MDSSIFLLLIRSLFYGKYGKCKKYRWLPRELPSSFTLCFMDDVENVEIIGFSIGGWFAHCLSVLLKMWKMRKISVAPSVAPLLIGYLFYRKCSGELRHVQKIFGSTAFFKKQYRGLKLTRHLIGWFFVSCVSFAENDFLNNSTRRRKYGGRRRVKLVCCLLHFSI